jgi:diguanylate cyclase (GGDEF)-like protein
MYDEKLARRILEILNEAFPTTVGLPDLKKALPEYSPLEDTEWLLALDALNKEQYIDGIFARVGFNQVVGAVARLEITRLGRRRLSEMKLSVADSMRDESEGLDPLTQIRNRGEFDKAIRSSLEAANKDRPLCLLMVDVDHFKSINDTHGHQTGDTVLKQVAASLKAICDGRGSCYRYGGDEMTVLLPNHTINEAVAVGERIRLVIRQATYEAYPEGVTVSLGLAAYPETSFGTSDQLLKQADEALYQAKANGRDRVCKPNQRS